MKKSSNIQLRNTILFSTLLQFACILILPVLSSNAQNLDSLQSEINKEKSPIVKTELLFELASQQVNPEMAIDYYEQALNISENANSDSLTIRILIGLIKNLSVLGHLHRADTLLEVAFNKYENSNDLKLKALLLNAKGNYLYYTGDYQQSTDAFIEAYEICDSIDFKEELILCNNNLGRVFWKIGNYDKAYYYFEKTYSLAKEQSNLRYQAAGLGNMALVFRVRNDMDSAIYYYKQSQSVYTALNDTFNLAISFQNIGNSYHILNRNQDAFDAFKKANEYHHLINNYHGIAITYNNLAGIYRDSSNFKQALEYYERALDISESHNLNGLTEIIYENIATVNFHLNNYEIAYHFLRKHLLLKDSIMNQDHLNAIEELEVKYETEKKENEILSLSQQNLIQEQQLAQRNMFLRSLGIGIVVLVIIGGLSFALYSQRTKNKQQLAIIDAISQTQENERKRIATALHDSIGSALAGIKMQIENVFSDRYPTKSARHTVQLIDETANEVRRISHDLIPGVLLKLGLDDSLKDMVNQIDNNTSIQASYESFGMDKRLSSETEVKIFRICQELIQNALKHGKPERLNLQITRHANKLNIIIEDNGHGFDKSSFSSDGIGMANMKHQVSTIKGNLQVESTKGQGTTVIIDIPVS